MDAAVRDEIARVAESELAHYGKDPRVGLYWQTAGQSASTQADWCGAFVVWVMRTAGVTVPNWIMGNGWIDPAHLRVTSDPQPGDVLYKDQPWQHESVVVARQGNTVWTIDGNSPKISKNAHQLGTPGIVYYSVQSLPARAPGMSDLKKGGLAALATLVSVWAWRRYRKRR